eukprot:TRINITY_DN18424_c0_g1_i1.p1 TRINITY_DN18424_c0_g1~~TRINITY_DN18424_c0_g1_i1.p1  ORF type:complete len:341 (-),score=28.66 TRINITY_DN18424_c0_g1_i1:108-1130(-)
MMRDALYAVWNEVSNSPDAYLLRSLDSVAYPVDRHSDLNTIKQNLDLDCYADVPSFASDVRSALSLLRSSFPGSHREASALESLFNSALSRHALTDLAACSDGGRVYHRQPRRSRGSHRNVELLVYSPSENWDHLNLDDELHLLDDPLFDFDDVASTAADGPPAPDSSFTISFSFNNGVFAGDDGLSDNFISDLLDDRSSAADDDSNSDQCSVHVSSSEEDIPALIQHEAVMQPLALPPPKPPSSGKRKRRSDTDYDAPKSRRRGDSVQSVALSSVGTKITIAFAKGDVSHDRSKKRRPPRQPNKKMSAEVFSRTQVVRLQENSDDEDEIVDIGDESDCL